MFHRAIKSPGGAKDRSRLVLRPSGSDSVFHTATLALTRWATFFGASGAKIWANQLINRCFYKTRMRTSPVADSELIARAQRGEVEAFCLLAANHQRGLYLLALKFSGNHHDAEDLTQEVMLNAFKSIKQFKGMSSF